MYIYMYIYIYVYIYIYMDISIYIYGYVKICPRTLDSFNQENRDVDGEYMDRMQGGFPQICLFTG